MFILKTSECCGLVGGFARSGSVHLHQGSPEKKLQIFLDVFRMSSFFPDGSRQSFRLGRKTELLNEKGRNKHNCEKVVVSPTFLCCTLQNISSFLKKHTYLNEYMSSIRQLP